MNYPLEQSTGIIELEDDEMLTFFLSLRPLAMRFHLKQGDPALAQWYTTYDVENPQ